MEAVYIQAGADIAFQLAAVFYGDAVADVAARIRALHMIERMAGLMGGILIDGAAAGHIENLHSPTDRKDRFCGF